MTGSGRSVESQRIFLTGEPGCGKTTVVRRAVDKLAALGLKVGGMLSGEVREGDMRVGFSVQDIITHERGVLADVGRSAGPRVGKYTVNIRDLERIGAGAIQRAIRAADVVILDELGPMELHSPRFIESVRLALSSQKHVLGTIHKRANHPFIIEVKSNPRCAILEVTRETRGNLPSMIVARIIGRNEVP
jgi:nucleoside-triphosphatase